VSGNTQRAAVRGGDAGVEPGAPGTFRFELESPLHGAPLGQASETEIPASVSGALILRSILWLCRLRWVAVFGLAAFGTLGLLPGLLPRIGLRPQPEWPFAAAAVLALANLGFLAHAKRRRRPDAPVRLAPNLWAQIVVDLLVLTVVVHYMGSLETYAAFAYLFHIVLACIFFPRPRSFVVIAMACGLYATCVALEEAGVVPRASIYADGAIRELIVRLPGAPLLDVAWAIVTWIVVWYLASSLSAIVRKRDEELAETNRRLVEAQEEKTRHMVRTTHELKAPFAAVDANAQLLLKGHCGALPPEARACVLRIAARSRRLARQIQEVLQMASLQSARDDSRLSARLDLAGVLRWCIAQVRPMAQERDVAVADDLQPAYTVAVEDHMKMLFSNLLANAVVYSHRGGRVEVRCVQAEDRWPLVTITDHGIGIPAEKLPHIFESYYRAEEAVRHHKESTGLGLAIVKRIAETYGVRVHVESAPGEGTRFALRFEGRDTAANGQRKEIAGGVRADR